MNNTIAHQDSVPATPWIRQWSGLSIGLDARDLMWEPRPGWVGGGWGGWGSVCVCGGGEGGGAEIRWMDVLGVWVWNGCSGRRCCSRTQGDDRSEWRTLRIICGALACILHSLSDIILTWDLASWRSLTWFDVVPEISVTHVVKVSSQVLEFFQREAERENHRRRQDGGCVLCYCDSELWPWKRWQARP